MAPPPPPPRRAVSRETSHGTIVSLPPLPPSPKPTKVTSSKPPTDPSALLDTLDSYAPNPPHPPTTGGKSPLKPPPTATSEFDPIEFLNKHYQTESALVSSLPPLRSTIDTRINRLDDSISNAIQRQSELADDAAADVNRAKSAILNLHQRIKLVQSKAQLSEKAVLEITRDMKRLDYAKRHLQRTITALKRLHMLIHAVEQLRLASLERPYPDYKTAANLVDATRLLLGHFEGYMVKVEKMREVKGKVGGIQEELRKGVVRGYRIVGFGEAKALEMEGGTKNSSGAGGGSKAVTAAASSTGVSSTAGTSDQAGTTKDSASARVASPKPAPPMPTPVLQSATLLIDSLGSPTRTAFVQLFCSDHLAAYQTHFAPPSSSSSSGAASAAEKGAKSFKIKMASSTSMDSSSHDAGGGEKPPWCLDQVERRFAWYRRLLREVMDEKFPHVFPRYWNVQFEMTLMFLDKTRDHFLSLLKDGPNKDRDSENVTILLQALQKSILFEKEMTAWLQRDYGTVFMDPNKAAAEGKQGSPSSAGAAPSAPILGEEGEALEFDEAGRAVAADSAQGIKIKYERKMRQKRSKGGEETADDEAGGEMKSGEKACEEIVPVRPLLGVASCAFDDYMSPYISLEEQNMDEQLVESTSDSAVDTRGDLPVFTSSTGLFVYIRNSITRCTVLTKGRTFYLLHQAFQDTLRKYATVLSGKFPPPVSTAVGGISIPGGIASTLSGKQGADGAGNASASYRIPPGEEVTVCHVIDTCEYCADTVEALEDMIRDTIDEEYKSKIDMSGEQEAFHDVTARGIRVLVSGLEHRTEGAFKEMSGTNWGTLDVVGEESAYVRSMHDAIQPFVVTVKGLIPTSYFRNFCDKFASAFTTSYYNSIVRQKRISESGTQQLLLDVYNLKTLLLKLPVVEKGSSSSSRPGSPARSAGSTIPPAMYTKMVTKQFARIELLLKLVGTPTDLLIDVFKAQWVGGSALDLQTVMNLKGIRRNEQTSMLEKFGVDHTTALKGTAIGATTGSTMTDHVQALQSGVASRVTNELDEINQKVANFRKAFR